MSEYKQDKPKHIQFVADFKFLEFTGNFLETVERFWKMYSNHFQERSLLYFSLPSQYISKKESDKNTVIVLIVNQILITSERKKVEEFSRRNNVQLGT